MSILLIVEQGGTVGSGVSKTTTILLAAPGKTSTKLDKAKAQGISVMDASAFRKKFKL